MGNARCGCRASVTACALAILIVGCSTSINLSEIAESQLREKESGSRPPALMLASAPRPAANAPTETASSPNTSRNTLKCGMAKEMD